jgi:hypothetical protein
VELTILQFLLYTESMNRKDIPIRDFPLSVILFFIYFSVSERLYVTSWTQGLETIPTLALTGVMLGMLLGISKFRTRNVVWLAMGYSIPVIILVVGGILSTGPLNLDGFLRLFHRLENSVLIFMTGQPVKDTALFITFISIAYWMVSLYSGYTLLRRGNYSGAVVPAGIILIVIQLYDPSGGENNFFLAIYFFLSLLLLGRLTYAQNRQYWKTQRVAYLDESGSELNVAIFLTTLALVILSWTAPSWGHTIESVKEFWTNLTHPLQNIQEDLGQAVAGIEGQGSQVVISYGDSLALGRQAAMGDAEYLKILGPRNQNPTRFYWRIRSYNVYLGGKWSTEGNLTEPFTSNLPPIALPDLSGSITRRFSFTTHMVGLSILVTPGRPEWVSVTSSLVYFPAGEGYIDPVYFQPDDAIVAGDRYVVEANISEPTISQLRSSGDTYPSWVTDDYLQLPDDLPAEVSDLALQIASQHETVYDIASAITQYLRNQITYSPTVQDPPEGRDPIDWFLFDSKKGFCNYYASAEVLLLRSLGIPSRLAVGFAQGEYEPPSMYTVLQSDAHAWPEVYFPGTGWVEFEPTASQPQLSRPPGINALPGEGTGTPNPNATPQASLQGGTPTPQPGGKSGFGNSHLTLLQAGLLGIFLLLMVIVLWVFSPFGIFDGFLMLQRKIIKKAIPSLLAGLLKKLSIPLPGWLDRWMYLSTLNPIEKSFMVIYQSLKRLNVKYPASLTPARAAALLEQILPEAAPVIRTLLMEHQRSVFGRETGDSLKAGNSERAIRLISLKALFRRYWNFLSK